MKLVALTAEFMSHLCPDDVKLLRASQDSVHTIASMFRFSYLWLAGVSWMSLEALGMDMVGAVLRSVTLLSHLTLMHSRSHREVVQQAMRLVLLRLPCRRPRADEHLTHGTNRNPIGVPLRLASLRRGVAIVARTPDSVCCSPCISPAGPFTSPPRQQTQQQQHYTTAKQED